MSRHVFIGTIALFFGLLLYGCTDEETGVTIASHPYQALEFEEEEGTVTGFTCAFQDEFGGAVSAGSMVIDLTELANREVSVAVPGITGLVTVQSDFIVNVDMQSALEPTTGYRSLGETTDLRTETNQIEVRAISFSFEAGDNNFALDSLDKEIPMTRIVYPGGILHSTSSVIDTATADVETWRDVLVGITNNDPNAIAPAVMTIQASGVLQGGTEVVSNRLKMPVEICDGCLKSTTPFCLPFES